MSHHHHHHHGHGIKNTRVLMFCFAFVRILLGDILALLVTSWLTWFHIKKDFANSHSLHTVFPQKNLGHGSQHWHHVSHSQLVFHFAIQVLVDVNGSGFDRCFRHISTKHQRSNNPAGCVACCWCHLRLLHLRDTQHTDL